MKKIITVLVLLTVAGGAFAQEMCSPDDRAALAACVEQCKATCEAAKPNCEAQPISLEAIREAIAAKCNCAAARNYGAYRSCVARLMSSLRAFALVDMESRAAVNEDNKLCRAQIMARKRHRGRPTPTPTPTMAP